MIKNITYLLFTPFLVTSAFTVHAQKQRLPQLGVNTIEEVVAAMTLEEKARTVVGTAELPKIPPPPAPGAPVRPPLPAGFDFGTFFSRGKVSGSAGESYAVPRLGIPSVIYADGPAGLRIDAVRNKDSSRKYHATAFPIATLMASSWDVDLVNRVGKAMGNEVHNYGVDVLLSPGMNIQRNPLTGRNFEYYSEDPFVTGSMATAMVKGLQSNGVGACIKHFAVNNQETFRNGVNAILSERALREIYLKGFEMTVKQAQPWTVMTSYNKVNGTYTSEREDLLTTILRKEWGFKGFVMTDWWAENDAVTHMKAGNDLLMPGTPDQIKEIIAAVQNGSLSKKVLDDNVAHILSVVVQSPAFKKFKYTDAPNLKAHAQIARQAAAEGMILLKNDDKALPFKSNIKKVATFGVSAYNTVVGGSGSGFVNRAYEVVLADGLTNLGLKIDVPTRKFYDEYITKQRAAVPPATLWKAPKFPEPALELSVIENLANTTDVALITIGRNSGEGKDRKLEDYYLTEEEKKQIGAIATAFHSKGKKVVAVLNVGGVIEVASWRNNFDAILLAWQPGQEAGNAIADVLTGKVNPSGKLAVSFPVDYKDVPSAGNFPSSKGNQGQVIYEEGVYVGYRYYNTFKVKPAYEFGFGKSYTNFAYSNLKLSTNTFTRQITATIKITNTGKIAGKEVVQLYITAPKSTLDKPESELKAFAKTRLLKPGETQVLSFTLDAASLASFYTNVHEWVADAGTYTLKINTSSAQVQQSAQFKLAKAITVQKVNKAVAPGIAITEMHPNALSAQ
jgi:beta-glucosidase